MEKLNRAAKCSILGPQNLGSGGEARAPGAPPWIRGCSLTFRFLLFSFDPDKPVLQPLKTVTFPSG